MLICIIIPGGRPSAHTLRSTGIVQACCWYTGVVLRILMTPQPSQMLFLQNNLSFTPLPPRTYIFDARREAKPSGPSETCERRAYGV